MRQISLFLCCLSVESTTFMNTIKKSQGGVHWDDRKICLLLIFCIDKRDAAVVDRRVE